MHFKTTTITASEKIVSSTFDKHLTAFNWTKKACKLNPVLKTHTLIGQSAESFCLQCFQYFIEELVLSQWPASPKTNWRKVDHKQNISDVRGKRYFYIISLVLIYLQSCSDPSAAFLTCWCVLPNRREEVVHQRWFGQTERDVHTRSSHCRLSDCHREALDWVWPSLRRWKCLNHCSGYITTHYILWLYIRLMINR